MILGLAGTHRSGKSTLARDVAERAGIGYYDGSFGRLAKTLGYESVAKMDIAERLSMQHRVLDLYDREIRQDGGGRITDRTPFDMCAYLIAEVGMHAGLEEAASRSVVAYRDRCIALTRELFDAVFLLQPLPVYVVADGKPSGDPAYQQHIQMLIEGGIHAARGSVRAIPVDAHDHTTRIRMVLDAMPTVAGHSLRAIRKECGRG
ncbi:AAA family ATPase [Methylobacterium sp. 092160098-2]|uniref:AAA family ATPase n=1 Tax=Methylobacterium sp. 092160098-2 TaxID=3025129 RepID=UPI002381A4AA|nr:AAA family ATPase [Methylobacterium sp. 092160098-2]MDE4914807.1 AAA family ATPase [Methylobacterium sp. 092160098-2]